MSVFLSQNLSQKFSFLIVTYLGWWMNREKYLGSGDIIERMDNKLTIFFTFSAEKTPPGFPVITQSPSTRVIEIGHTAVMQCRATGNPQPKIYWLKEGKRVDMTNPRYSLIDGKYF
jgi:receptor-type tyrosine-protein phosphatase F